jgi:hypothetical protein
MCTGCPGSLGAMIGGTVLETIPLADKVWVLCCEAGDHSQQGAIYVERDDRALVIEPGDFVWWQDMTAMWTPRANMSGNRADQRSGVDYDRQLRKIGYSGAARPALNVIILRIRE